MICSVVQYCINRSVVLNLVDSKRPMVKDNIQKGLQDISGTSAIIHKAIHFFTFGNTLV